MTPHICHSLLVQLTQLDQTQLPSVHPPDVMVLGRAVFNLSPGAGKMTRRVRLLPVQVQRPKFKSPCKVPVVGKSMLAACQGQRQDCWGLLATSLAPHSVRVSQGNKVDRTRYLASSSLSSVYVHAPPPSIYTQITKEYVRIFSS